MVMPEIRFIGMPWRPPLSRPLASLVGAVRTTAPTDAAHLIAPAGASAPLLAARAGDALTLVLTATGNDADALETALGAYLDPEEIAVFPSWETLPHERLSPRSDTVARRLATLRRVTHPAEAARESGMLAPRIVIAPLRAALQPLAPGLADLEPVRVAKGEMLDLEVLTRSLAGAAYTRVDMVERRGEFAVRGGIVDVFAPTDAHPTRIEFFGDEVESLRLFSVADQRSLAEVDRLWAPPCRELLLTDEVRSRAHSMIAVLPAAADLLTRVAAGNAVEGMESLLPVLVDRLASLVELMPRGTTVVALEPERLARRAEDLQHTAQEFLAAAWVGATAGADAPVDLGEVADQAADSPLAKGGFLTIAELREAIDTARLDWATIGPFGGEDTQPAGIGEIESFKGRPGAALDHARVSASLGWRVIVAAAGTGSAQRIAEQCRDASVAARVVEALDVEGERGVVDIVAGVSGVGFSLDEERILVLHESDLTGRAASTAGPKVKVPSRRRNVVDPLQLSPGDHVVHESHGVGRFVELMKRTVRGVEREYLVIEYAPSKRGGPADKLSVPTDQLDLVTKYVGGEAPAVNKMGGADWTKTKAARARRSRRSPPSSFASTARAWRPRAANLALTRRGSASSRRRSRTSRPPISSPQSTRSRPTWRRPSRWTGSCAATWDLGRPRSRCAPHSRRSRTAPRWRSCAPRRSWSSSTWTPSPSASRPSPSR